MAKDQEVEIQGLDDLLAGGRIQGARPYQEDEFRITACRDADPDGCDVLMVVADGMGGHQGGAEASHLAVTGFVEAFDAAAGEGVAARLRASLDAANAAIGRRRRGNFSLMGMGCTLLACAVTDGGELHWISVGDSPLWRVRVGEAGNAELRRLNEDHSMKPVLAERLRRGEITAEEARWGANQLLSAVLGGRIEMVDEGRLDDGLRPGDMLLLASDGVETLSEEEIGRRCVEGGDAAEIVRDILRAVEAAEVPTQDNATVIVYRHER